MKDDLGFNIKLVSLIEEYTCFMVVHLRTMQTRKLQQNIWGCMFSTLKTL